MSNNNILAELADFDIKYAKYIYCNNATNNTSSCTDADKNKDTLTNAYNKLVSQGPNGANLINLQNVITSMNVNDKMTKAQYDASLNSLIAKHQNLLAFRRNLDDKMQILYNVDNENYTDNKLKYDATVYSGIIWTVLASSIVYYMFTKL
jgi:hypothetical protein